MLADCELAGDDDHYNECGEAILIKTPAWNISVEIQVMSKDRRLGRGKGLE